MRLLPILLLPCALAAASCGGGSGGGGAGGPTPPSSALAGLSVSWGRMTPAFSPGVTTYDVDLGLLAPSVSVTATAEDPAATILVAGLPVPSGTPSALAALLPAGVTPIEVRVTASDASSETVTVLNVSRGTGTATQSYVKASTNGAAAGFGRTVAVFGDTVVVGAPFESGAGSGVNANETPLTAGGSGAAYVFVRSGATWVQQAYLKASNAEAGDQFGCAVALHGDTLVVGACFEDSSAAGVNGNQADNAASGSGAAYVFVRSGTTWSQQAYLKASNTGASDEFGTALAVHGDTIVVGAHLEDSSATGVNGTQADESAGGSGAAYVFVRSGTIWSQQAYLKASNAGTSDEFAAALALENDTLAVGAPFERSNATGIGGNQADNSAPDAGAVYVFVRAAGAWSQQAYVKASNAEGGDTFGAAVALSGQTLVVGAPQEGSSATAAPGGPGEADNAAALSGAAYVFVRSGSTWTQERYLKATNTDAGDRFGDAVGVSGDSIVVGAWGDDSASTGVGGAQGNNGATSDSGALFWYTRGGTVWNVRAYIKATNTGAGDLYGFKVALQGDTLVVGAPDEDSNATGVGGNGADNSAPSSGAAYILR